VYKKEKEKLLALIDELDIKAETIPLVCLEREALRNANDCLAKLQYEEEAKWAQRAKVKHVQEGGNNTKYFHLIANGKHRKKENFQLEQDEGIIVREENLKVYIIEYYKKLFGAPTENNFILREDLVADIAQLSTEENNILTVDFTQEEVFDAISQMELNKAPVPDGFPAEFYIQFWEVIKYHLMKLFDQLRHGDLPLFKLNFGVITFLPKKKMRFNLNNICLYVYLM
jgi:mannosylglycoprotein endo-beta-mannosidase